MGRMGVGSASLRELPHTLNRGLVNGSLASCGTRELEPMLSRELADLRTLSREGPAQGVVLEAPPGQESSSRHAGVSRLGQAEVQSEIHIARHAHDAALDDEHVGPFLATCAETSRGARDIAHDRPALPVVGLNDRGYGAGHRHYQVDLRQRGVYIGAQINRRATLDLTATCSIRAGSRSMRVRRPHRAPGVWRSPRRWSRQRRSRQPGRRMAPCPVGDRP